MKNRLIQNSIYVKKSKMHGYGVFASKTIRKGKIIEQCYFILSKNVNKVLEDFCFEAKKGMDALLTGYGSIYNHADEPNADYTLNMTKRIATIKATKTIKKGEEIFVSYGDEWFSSRGLKAKKPPKNKRAMKNKN